MAIGAAITQAGAKWEKREPSRVGSLSGDLLLPVSQSFVTALVALVIARILGKWSSAIIVAVLTFGVTWLLLLVDHRRALWAIETIIGKDIDGDGQKGKPEPRLVRVEVVEDNDQTKRMAWYDLPATEDQLTQLAEALFIKRQPFSRRALAGRDNPFSDPGFRALQAKMLEAELLWPAGDGPNAGYKLSPIGRQFLTQFLPGHQVGGAGVGGDWGTNPATQNPKGRGL